MRKRGFRLVQMWLPDTRTPEFAEQAHKDSLAIANSPTEAEDQAFVDSISWWNSPEARELEKNEPPTPGVPTDNPIETRRNLDHRGRARLRRQAAARNCSSKRPIRPHSIYHRLSAHHYHIRMSMRVSRSLLRRRTPCKIHSDAMVDKISTIPKSQKSDGGSVNWTVPTSCFSISVWFCFSVLPSSNRGIFRLTPSPVRPRAGRKCG